MNIKEDIRPISYVKAHAADILIQINETKRPLYVTQNGEAKAVIIDTESFQNMQNAIGILKLLTQSEQDVTEKKIIKHNDAMSRIEKKLSKPHA